MSSSSERYLKKVMRGVEVKHLTLHEAKRTQRHIYGALLSELYFEACTVCAKYFEYLKCEEDALIEDNFITQRMEGNRVELLKLFETCKAAELATKLKACLSRKTAYELLYQALNITRNLHSTYWWLTRSFFEIVIEVTDTFGLNDVLCSEMRAKIYTHYAIFQLNNSEFYHLQVVSAIALSNDRAELLAGFARADGLRVAKVALFQKIKKKYSSY